ncbi:diguanylate cyclase [bacterium]|nr:diguanylate cyclase [bacterium]
MIFVVDDEANNRLLLKTYLTAEGYDVRFARNGQEALRTVSDIQPDVIVLDVMLPNMDGYDVCRELKASEEFKYIPIILATALRGNEERIRGIEAGADDFISKPYNKVELTTRIKSLVRIGTLYRALAEKVEELEIAKKKLNKLAVTDGLTDLFNYRAFQHRLHLEIQRSKRFGLPLSLLMIDIDHFKRYNDTFGHPAGDTLLREFAEMLRTHVREVDCPARYGGEEFVLILPGTAKQSALIVGEKIRNLIQETDFSGTRVTVSIGIASYPEDTDTRDMLITLADQALYRAKEEGRNRTILCPDTGVQK